MTHSYLIKSILSAGTTLALLTVAAIFTLSPRVQADDGNKNDDRPKVRQGFAIAPVPLNLTGKNRTLVGLGSYLVNAVGDCNGCHSAGATTQYSPGGNPFFGQRPAKVNPATYLGGGNDFGPFPGPGTFPHIISRNLTPDKTGLPIGGASFNEFVRVMRTGVDPDHLHPTCTGAPDGKCIPAPFDGSLLQIMPWPTYQNISDRNLLAIYTYLSAIPCIAGPAAPDPRHHDCN